MNNLDKILKKTKDLMKAKIQEREKLEKKNKQNQHRIIFPGIIFKKNDISIQVQKWLFNGFIIEYGDLKLCVDPGVDFLSRCSQGGILLCDISTLFISHAHLDHYASANVVSEQIALAGKWGDATFLLPESVIKNKVISDYHRGDNSNKEKPEIIVLEDKKDILLNSYSITPIKIHHSIDNSFGFILDLGLFKIGYTSDTGYARTILVENNEMMIDDIKEPLYKEAQIIEKRKDLKEKFSSCDILIANINGVEFNKHSKTHLCVFDVLDIVCNSQIKLLILAHMNTNPILNNHLNEEITTFVEKMSGIKTISLSQDLLEISLDQIK